MGGLEVADSPLPLQFLISVMLLKSFIIMSNLARMSKKIAHALRHDPAHYGLNLDADGWVDIADLLRALRAAKGSTADITRADLDAIIATEDKPRYEIQAERIRALHGHSAQKLRYPPSAPPEYLYHGTSAAYQATILQEGLRPMQRQYVHLALDREMAAEVGSRKAGETVILQIAAAEAWSAGILFYTSSPAVWLADAIPPQFIRVG